MHNLRVLVFGSAFSMAMTLAACASDPSDVPPADGGTTSDAARLAPTACPTGQDNECDDGNDCTHDVCLQGNVCLHSADVGVCTLAGTGNACKTSANFGQQGCYFTCGDGLCDANSESHDTCPADCAAPPPACPDVAAQEDGYTCTDAQCGADFIVRQIPNSGACPTGWVCGPSKSSDKSGCYNPCGDGTCNAAAGETTASCAIDCPAPPPPPMCDPAAQNDNVDCTTDVCGADYQWRHVATNALCTDPAKPVCNATLGCVAVPTPVPTLPTGTIDAKADGNGNVTMTIYGPLLINLRDGTGFTIGSGSLIAYGAGGDWGYPYANGSTRKTTPVTTDGATYTITVPASDLAGGINFLVFTPNLGTRWFDLTSTSPDDGKGNDGWGGHFTVTGDARISPAGGFKITK